MKLIGNPPKREFCEDNRLAEPFTDEFFRIYPYYNSIAIDDMIHYISGPLWKRMVIRDMVKKAVQNETNN